MSRMRYGKAIASCAALAAFALLFAIVLTHIGRAKPRAAPLPHPDGTTLANEVEREGIKPGNYATAINIHNPSLRTTVALYKRAVLAPPEQTPPQQIPPSAFQSYSLGPGYAVEVDCADIVTLLSTTDPPPSGFIKGFVTILATAPLDIVRVYSAEPPAVTIPNPSDTTQTEIPGITQEMLNIEPQVVVVRSRTASAVPRRAGILSIRRNSFAKKLLHHHHPRRRLRPATALSG